MLDLVDDLDGNHPNFIHDTSSGGNACCTNVSLRYLNWLKSCGSDMTLSKYQYFDTIFHCDLDIEDSDED